MLHHLSSEIRKSPEVGRMTPLIKNLVRLINELQQERGRGLIFVGYSYGGLLVKQVCIRLYVFLVFEWI
jgi:surfactin synthase thioesterase subunit